MIKRFTLGSLGPVGAPGILSLPLFGHPLIHNVQIGIGQQWADNSSLWGSVLIHGTFIHNPSPQHCFDDLQYTPVLDADVIQTP